MITATLPTTVRSTPRRRRPRIRLRAVSRRHAAVAAVVFLLVWTVFEQVIVRPDRFRPLVVAELEKATELPVNIGQLDLALFPLPHLNLWDVRIGSGEFQVTSPRVSTYPNLFALATGSLAISSIDVTDVNATVSADPVQLAEDINVLVSSLINMETGGAAEFELTAVDEVRLNDASIFFAGSENPVACVSARISDALSDLVVVALDSRFPDFGDGAVLNSELRVAVGEFGVESIEGAGALKSMQLARAIGLENAADAELAATIDVEGADHTDLTVTVAGDMESRVSPSLDGPFSTTVVWRDGIIAFNDLSWETSDSAVFADIVYDGQGETACTIPEINLSQAALAALLELSPFDNFRLEAVSGSSFRADNVELNISPEGIPRITQGAVYFDGIVASLPSGEKIDRGIRGHLEAVDGVVRIHELRGTDFSVDGTIHSDPDTKSVRIDLLGEAKLTRELVAALIPREEIHDAEGVLQFERIAGTFVKGEGLPDDLVIDADLTSAKVVLAGSAVEGVFEPITGEIRTDAEGINTVAQATSEHFGDVSLNGRYTFDSHEWLGTATIDVARLLDPFSGDIVHDYLGNTLDQLGESRFQTKIALPYKDHPDLSIHTMRDGLPFFKTDLSFVRCGAGYALGPLEILARFDVNELDTPFLGNVDARGQGTVTFVRDPYEKRHETRIDLTDCSLKLAKHVEKKPGDSLTVTIAGTASEVEWTTDEITLDLVGVEIPLALLESGVAIENFSADIAPLGALMPEGGSAHGTLAMRMTPVPFELEMEFDGAGFTATPEIAADEVNGTLRFRDGLVTTDQFTIVGVNSDATLLAEIRGGEWTGQVTGDKLDMNFVNLFWDSTMAFFPDDGEVEVAEEAFMGAFDLDVGSVYLGRCRVDNVRAALVSDERGVRIRDLSMRGYTGTIDGSVDISPATRRDRFIDLSLKFNGVEARILDELLMDEPANIYGIVNGGLDLRMPWGNGESMIGGANGTIEYVSRDGSYGKLGFATQLLTALKTTRIINLKLPTLRDQGLTYDECFATLSFKDGVMEIKRFALESPDYTMDGSGVVNWPEDDMDVYVFVGVLENIGRLVEKVPLVRKIKRVTTDLVGVGVQGTGPPLDPAFGIVSSDRDTEEDTGTDSPQS